MGFAFAAPFLFAGLGLLIGPYIIHQIRRPEREPVKFSSLLFIPNIQKEVIERKRIQHILLMLMRMAALALLAIAFTRPYWKAPAMASGNEGPIRHFVLLDTSYSMGVGDSFAKAKAEALSVVASAKDGELVGFMSFGQIPHIQAPFNGAAQGEKIQRDEIQRFINAATLTAEATDYQRALETAYRHTVQGSDGLEGRLIIHLISDFRKNGMPEKVTGWKLPQQVELNPISIQSPKMENLSITDSGLRRYPNGDVRVMAKVRNWTDEDQSDLLVRFVIDGEEVANNTIKVKAGSATQTSCRYTPIQAEQLEGSIVLEVDDDLEIDNTRFFSWQLPRKRSVAVVSDFDPGLRWPAHVFFTNALPNEQDTAWTTDLYPPQELRALLAADFGRPDVVILATETIPTQPQMAQLNDYVQQGGSLVVTMNPDWAPDMINASIFAGLPLEATGWKHDTPRETRYELMSWVDLTHPIFVPFNGTKFNDFSMLRFFNYLEVKANEDANVIAEYESEDPAIVDITSGEGKIIVWSFGMQLTQSNMPKHARFVPLLYETLWYLGGQDTPGATHFVGESIDSNSLAYNEDGQGEIQLPETEDIQVIRAEEIQRQSGLYLERPGLLKIRRASAEAWARMEAVNVHGEEGNDSAIDTTEFSMKLAAAPMVEDTNAMAGVVGSKMDKDGNVMETEYGPTVLGLIVLLLLFESVYMTFLSRRPPTPSS